MISVVIPLYNKEHSILKAVQSVLNQTFEDFEVIIVNDGSTDNSVKVLKELNSHKIRIINKANGGVSSARNRGIKESNSDFVAFLDGDDWWDPSFLMTLTNLKVKYPDAGIYTGKYLMVYNKKKSVKQNIFPEKEGYFDIYTHLHSIHSSSILVNKKVFEVCGFFDENLTHGEDIDMWIRIGYKFKLCYSDQIISFYNLGGNPLSRSVGKFPSYDKNYISKIDDYLIEGNEEWNNFLMTKKATGLKMYLKRHPLDKEYQLKIKELPYELRHKLNLLNIEKYKYAYFLESVFFIYSKRFLKIAVFKFFKHFNILK